MITLSSLAGGCKCKLRCLCTNCMAFCQGWRHTPADLASWYSILLGHVWAAHVLPSTPTYVNWAFAVHCTNARAILIVVLTQTNHSFYYEKNGWTAKLWLFMKRQRFFQSYIALTWLSCSSRHQRERQLKEVSTYEGSCKASVTRKQSSWNSAPDKQ